MLTLTIEIPALERLCGWLESRDKSDLVQQIEDEIVSKLHEAAGSGALEKAAKAPAPACATCADYVTAKEAAPEPRRAAQEPPKPEPTEKPSEVAEAVPTGKPATLADIQKAAAQMRDDGKLQAVKDLFPEFGIRKLSDLKDAQLQTFADKLRGMGARI